MLTKLMGCLEQDSQAFMIKSSENILYYTGFQTSNARIIVTRGQCVFLTDSRYIEKALKKISDCRVQELKNEKELLPSILQEMGISTLFIEADRMTVDELNRYEKMLDGVQIISDDTLKKQIDSQRVIKSDRELEKILQAQKIAEMAYEYILTRLRPGVTEREISLELDFFMLKNGAQAVSFDTIVVSGAKSSMPHGVPDGKVIEKGDFVTMDFGAVVEGYHSDMTRTVAVGSVTDEMREVYNIVLDAQTAALEKIAPGVELSAVDKAARDIISQNGYGDFFRHGTGHGVGIEIHENPTAAPPSTEILEPGMVLTVEPGIYLPGKFGVRIEDMVAITGKSYKNMTGVYKELTII